MSPSLTYLVFALGLLCASLSPAHQAIHTDTEELCHDYDAQSLKNSSIEYVLFSRSNTRNGQNLHPDDEVALNCSNFSPNRGTVLVLHGFFDVKAFSAWKLKLKDALINNHDLNVILIYYLEKDRRLLSSPVETTENVGNEVAKLISFISKSSGSPLESFHLIGHSLGAHIAGHAGSQLKSESSSLGRITGLDPAGATFNKKSAAERLDPTDAKLVDVIHTDAGTMWTLSMGSNVQSGHLDFWPNGGSFQPGCTAERLASASKGLFELARRIAACSHMRAYDYFIESLENKKCSFTAIKCPSYESFVKGHCGACDKDNCAKLGYYAAEENERFTGSSPLNFYLKTMDEESFCAYQYVIRIRTSDTQVESSGSKFTVTINGSAEAETVHFDADLEPNSNIKKLLSFSRDLGTIEKVFLVWTPKVLNCLLSEKAKTMSIARFQVERLEADLTQLPYTYQGESLEVKPNCLETIRLVA